MNESDLQIYNSYFFKLKEKFDKKLNYKIFSFKQR